MDNSSRRPEWGRSDSGCPHRSMGRLYGTPASVMVFFGQYPGGPVVALESNVLDIFDRFRQHRPWRREAGGQLFAQITGPHLIVKEATTPSQLDRRSRHSFQPHRPTEQWQIKQNFHRGLHFVGDWHTHPQLRPEPSVTDLQSVRDCLQRSRHDLKSLLLVVVGQRRDAGDLWVGIIGQRTVNKLDTVPQPPNWVQSTSLDHP